MDKIAKQYGSVGLGNYFAVDDIDSNSYPQKLRCVGKYRRITFSLIGLHHVLGKNRIRLIIRYC